MDPLDRSNPSFDFTSLKSRLPQRSIRNVQLDERRAHAQQGKFQCQYVNVATLSHLEIE